MMNLSRNGFVESLALYRPDDVIPDVSDVKHPRDRCMENRRIGPWRILRPIGRGGCATVYSARNDETGTDAAVKILLEELASERSHVRAFRTEGEILESFQHAGIPELYDLGEIDERPCLIMQLCEGLTLYQLLNEQRRFDRVGSFKIACKILAHVHSEHVIHGDVKAENYIVASDGRVRMVDFGSSKRTSGTRTFTSTFFKKKDVQGTPSYLAPELLRGKKNSFASDVYALGVLGHYLFAGTAPFTGDGKEMMRQARDLPAPSVSKRQPRLPKGLAAVVDRCCMHEADMRFEDAAEAYAAIKTFLKNTGMSTAQISAGLQSPSEEQLLSK